MNDKQLQDMAESISIRFFLKEFRHKAYFNPRLRTTGGRYLLSSHNIEVNKLYYEQKGLKEIEGIIKHELCHYHLHLEGKGYKHRDRDFKELLRKVEAPRFCSPLSNPGAKRKAIHYYKCETCGHLYSRKRRIDLKRYVCGKCKGCLKKVKNKVDLE
ncbi:SprT family protein [Priestia abyssalis]|uniref:SprT family protein n=1 Tax=Priestia abyssalis TaxID=1221450 RepID=UPI00099504EC|nr:SprT family protein [Priestia abyssalis]